MNLAKELGQLKIKQREIERQIANCHHEFKPPIYDPETVSEGYGMHLVGHGSDPYPEYAGYHDVQKDRWGRECKKCGFIQYTSHQGPVEPIETEPKFD